MRKLFTLAIAALLVCGVASAQYNPGTCYFGLGGASIVCQANATLQVDASATFSLFGTSVTATGAELNYLDITTLGTAQASKALTSDASLDTTGVRNFTLTGALSSATAAIGGGYGSTGCSISAAGVLQCNGAGTIDGLITGSAGATVTGAAISLNASSNFAVNINTGTSNGALSLGGGSGTVAINSTGWDITTAGAVTGIGDITAATGLAGGWDISSAASAADTAGQTTDVVGQAGGAASTDQVGQNGGAVTVTGGVGSAKDGAGANDGDGGDVVLTGGARGGTTAGTEVQGIVRVGSPTVGSTKTIDLLAIAGGLEVDGAARFDGAISSTNAAGISFSNSESVNNGVDGTFDLTRNDAGTVTVTASDDDAVAALTVAPGGAADLTLGSTSATSVVVQDDSATVTLNGGDVALSADATGGNAGAVNAFSGNIDIDLVAISTMANGTTNTVITDIGDSETPATDWTAIDADTTMTNDATYYRQGTASLKMAVATTAAATDGCTNTLASGDQDWTDDESVGMWFYADRTLTAGDLTLVITDSIAGDTSVNFPAYGTANVWEWIEIDVSGVANASKDVITDLSIELSAAGAAVAAGGAFNVYMDFIVKWDVAEEESLGHAIIQDGVKSVVVADVTSGGSSNSNLVLYTDYFVHYQSGNDAVVMITDQSGADKLGTVLCLY